MCNSAYAQVESDENTFTLNLKNTDIHSLIATVSKQTGRNFVVDPRVKAKVTVISTDPVNAEGLYEVFLSVLQVHGYSAVPAGDLTKIVPDVTAKQGPVPILGDERDNTDQLVTQVIKVVNVPAAQLVPILRPMVPQQGHLAAYAATNSLIITDRAANIQRIMTIIRRIDRPDNEEIEVVRLNHAAASEIVRTLSSLQRNNVGGPQGPGAMQLVADERTNSILISGDTAVRVRVRGLIAHLDTPIESGGNTRVVYLKYANAEDIVAILQGVSQGQARVGATTNNDGGAVQQRPTPTPNQQPQGQNQPQQNPQGNAGNNIAQNNNGVTPRSAPSGESSVDIQADPNTNALIITAPPDEMQNILAVIRQLDIRRAQVLVEAVIAEITEDNTREFGINFLLDGTDDEAPIGFTNLGGASDAVLGIAGATQAGTVPSTLGAGLSLALGRFDSGGIDFGVLIRAIASDADNNILSTPSIVTLDNEEAEIVVGSNVPFVTGQQLGTNNANPFQTIERRDVGLTLRVTPQINDGNTIKMDLEQEVSSVSPTAITGATDITTSTRQLSTTVLVEDGQTLVLGGLIDDQITDTVEKVPLLGDIPVLGNLFRFKTVQKSKRNLMIFLHPVILRDAETASQFSNAKYNFIRSRQNQKNDNNSTIHDGVELPELKLYFQGKDVDSPLTFLDAPGDSPQTPLASASPLTDPAIAAKETVRREEDTNPVSLPATADIDEVITAYQEQQAEQILSEQSAPLTPTEKAILSETPLVAETAVATETTAGTETPAAAETTAAADTSDVVTTETVNATASADVIEDVTTNVNEVTRTDITVSDAVRPIPTLRLFYKGNDIDSPLTTFDEPTEALSLPKLAESLPPTEPVTATTEPVDTTTTQTDKQALDQVTVQPLVTLKEVTNSRAVREPENEPSVPAKPAKPATDYVVEADEVELINLPFASLEDMVISDIPDTVTTAEVSESSQPSASVLLEVLIEEVEKAEKAEKGASSLPVAETNTAAKEPASRKVIPASKNALDQVLNHPAFHQTAVDEQSTDQSVASEQENAPSQQDTDVIADREERLRNLSLTSLEHLAVSDIPDQIETTEVPASSKSVSAEKNKDKLQRAEDTDAASDLDGYGSDQESANNSENSRSVDEQAQNESDTAENYRDSLVGEFAVESQTDLQSGHELSNSVSQQSPRY